MGCGNVDTASLLPTFPQPVGFDLLLDRWKQAVYVGRPELGLG